MKTLNKLIALSFILTTAFVFTSCSDIFEDNSDKGELILKIPSEKSARAVSDYDSYDFTVSITNRDTKVEESKEAKPGQACSFELESGFYNIKISASLSSDPDTILYEGSANDIEVIAGQTTKVPLITLTRLSRSWDIDLSNYIKYIQIVYNKWGPNYESTDIDITNSFDGSLPKAGDTINFTWKAKSDIDLKNLCMHIANIDFIGKGPGEWVKWTHLISSEDWNIVIASNIKAEEEFEAKASYVLTETPANNVKITLWYPEEVAAPALLYSGEKPDYTPVSLKIEGSTIKFKKPGNAKLDELISKGCNGYIVGIVSGTNKEGNPDWIYGKLFHLNDKNAFKDLNCFLELINAQSKIKNNKIYPIIDFYKNVSYEESEREFIEQVIGDEIEYSLDPDIVTPVLKLESETVKVTAPSEKFIDVLKNYDCRTYCIGIVAMTNDSGAYDWLFGKSVNLTDDDAFTDVDFGIDFSKYKSKINDRKIAAVIHYYRGNFESEEEREYITDLLSPAVTYEPDTKEYPLTLEGRRFGTECWHAKVSGTTITWLKGSHEGHVGWDLSGIDLSKYAKVRLELESSSVPVSLALNDTEHKNYHKFDRIEENILEADLTGYGCNYKDDGAETLDPSKGLIIFLDAWQEDNRTEDLTTIVKSVELLEASD